MRRRVRGMRATPASCLGGRYVADQPEPAAQFLAGSKSGCGRTTYARELRAEVRDRDAVLRLDPLGNQRPVARLGVALDAEERRRRPVERLGDGLEVGDVEDLGGVAMAVL